MHFGHAGLGQRAEGHCGIARHQRGGAGSGVGYPAFFTVPECPTFALTHTGAKRRHPALPTSRSIRIYESWICWADVCLGFLNGGVR